MQRTETDHAHLARAVELAQRGLGRVSPNPVVGAVIVRADVVLGEGWHEEHGGPHAAVNAILAPPRPGAPRGSPATTGGRRPHRGPPQAAPGPGGSGPPPADDPQLPAPTNALPRQPRRVVFDSTARLPLASRLVSGTADVPLVV